jgi:tetratricopeptide (TPR) repeat protein
MIAMGLTLPSMGGAQTGSGAYLAARSAAIGYDFQAAAKYFTQALAQDRTNLGLMENALIAQLSSGQVSSAAPLAQMLIAAGSDSQVARLVMTAQSVKDGAFDTISDQAGAADGLGNLVDQMSAAWALMGQGEVRAAIKRFDKLARQDNLRSFVLLHKAYALASVGDFEGAEAIFADASNGVIQNRRAVLARVQVMSQLGAHDQAQSFLQQMFAGANDPELATLAERLNRQEALPFDVVRDVQDGFAEVFFSVAGALQNETDPEYTLLYAQLARDLRPGDVDMILLVAELFEALEQYDLAISAYKQVPTKNHAYHIAELGRAAALRELDRPEAAVEVLEQLARTHSDLSIVHSSLGDAYRVLEDFGSAVTAYDRAIELQSDDSGAWFLYYARGISHERQKQWPKAEADFRAALKINPDQPQVLNYLGYSLVEHRIKLDEALALIERAVQASPDSGYIIDSLGWVLYRLGRYEEAVPHMERAAQLMAVDPVVNDHLGDVYWAVGRYREAEFQWMRALSFVDETDPNTEADPDRIRQKLDLGLDAVLEAEGAAPLRVAQD